MQSCLKRLVAAVADGRVVVEVAGLTGEVVEAAAKSSVEEVAAPAVWAWKNHLVVDRKAKMTALLLMFATAAVGVVVEEEEELKQLTVVAVAAEEAAVLIARRH